MDIKIYSTTTCAFCHTLTEWLDAKGFAYKKVDTDEDPAEMAEFMSVNDGNIGVPFTVITGTDGSVIKIVGFDQRRFKEVLGV